MASFNKTLIKLRKQLIQAVYATKVNGIGANKWRNVESVEDSGINKSRSFDVSLDKEQTPMGDSLMVGANTNEYNIYFNLNIVYANDFNGTATGLGDYNELSCAFRAISSSSITGLNFIRVDELQWLDDEDNEEIQYLVIPLMVRVSVPK